MMSLVKLVDVWRGGLCLKVFRSVRDGELLLAVDKVLGGRRIRGPMFTESDARFLVRLLDKEKYGELRMPGKEIVRNQSVPLYDASVARREVEGAIAACRNGQQRMLQKHSSVRILPTMPERQYSFTCRMCGCHVSSSPMVFGGTVVRVCANCR